MSPRASRTATALATPLLLVALQGCSTPMNADATTPARYPPPGHFQNIGSNSVAEGPLRFWEHSMGVYCFSTFGCRVQYGSQLIMDKPMDAWQPPAESYPHDLRGRMKGDILGLKNFQGPVELDWRDKAGETLHHTLDLNAIFADGLIKHRVPLNAINPDASVTPPAIIVEIEDRTIRVHMLAWIPLKTPRIPGNPYSNYVEDPITVFETTL